MSPSLAPRLRRLPVADVLGHRVPVAVRASARLLGLSYLDLDHVGEGLLLPDCRAVHTFGMRFALDIVFLDREGRALSVRRGVAPRRLAADRRAVATLELPAAPPSVQLVVAKSGPEGGESSSPLP